MGKISGKSLADKYRNFLEPCVKVMAAGKEIVVGDGVYLEKTEVISSVGMEPDMAVLTYRADKFSGEGVAGIEKCFEVGQKMEIKAGYGETAVRVFLGYLHEVETADVMLDYVEYTLICLDVKGLMKKNSMFRVPGSEKTAQVLEAILNTGCYKGFIEKKKMDALPKELNQEGMMKGETHYDWLCRLAVLADYEFYCGRGELVFQKACKPGPQTLELRVEYGLREVRRIVSMTEQTGKVQVWGYNRKDEKVSAVAAWPGVSGSFGNKIKQVLQGCEQVFWNMGLETGEQASQWAEAWMRRRARKSDRMKAVAMGMPDLAPGVCVELVNGNTASLSGVMYVEEVCHLADGGGYQTAISGVRI